MIICRANILRTTDRDTNRIIKGRCESSSGNGNSVIGVLLSPREADLGLLGKIPASHLHALRT